MVEEGDTGDIRRRPVAGAEPEKPSPIPSAAAQQPNLALCFGLGAVRGGLQEALQRQQWNLLSPL